MPTLPPHAGSKFPCLDLPDCDMMYMARRNCEVHHVTSRVSISGRFVQHQTAACGNRCLRTAWRSSARADERPAKPAGTASQSRRSRQAGCSRIGQAREGAHPTADPRSRKSALHGPPRRRHELRQIGAEAFDLLDAATDNADPEVAASASYLLRQIPVRWVQADDHPLVRRMMRNYGQETEARRDCDASKTWTRLPNGKGIAALCRIARFDRSPLVSRTAALAIIRPAEKPSEQPRIDPAVVERELGASTRASADVAAPISGSAARPGRFDRRLEDS